MTSFYRTNLSGPKKMTAAAAYVLFLTLSNRRVQNKNMHHRDDAVAVAVTTQCHYYQWYGFQDTSLPRPLKHCDPIWTLSKSQLRQRAHDDTRLRRILQEIQQQIALLLQRRKQQQQPLSQTPQADDDDDDDEQQCLQHIAKLQAEWLETAYGGDPGVTLADRQKFLEKYGCTGFTDEVLDCILDHMQAGIVELGAGNGQWARALSNRFNARQQQQQQQQSSKEKAASYQVVLAYDDMSQLPLDANVYHGGTKVAHDHFGNVRRLLFGHGIHNNNNGSDALKFTLQQWQCRGRALLLVYPPPASDMAATCAQAYANVVQDEHTILYVGEGRGGATANDAFFDYIESSAWQICQVLDVKRFGTKGYEKLYVLKKIKTDQ